MFKLRPYQQHAVDATLRHFRRSRTPALIVLPTGAGKSLVIAELARLARGRVLVLAHVKELVEQNFAKFQSYDLEAGIYSAGLSRKDSTHKVIFGGIQSVARAEDDFFKDFSLLVIDECHRVSLDEDTQYADVIRKLQMANPKLCILGLTATPYRLDSGWIYRFNNNTLRTDEPRFFERCLFELTLHEMLAEGYLTQPVQIDAPVASYDFSSLELPPGSETYRLEDIESILKDQSRITPIIIQNIVELSASRKGVILFTASVQHAKDILRHLPAEESALLIGDTPSQERDELIEKFKARQLKYLVNVSVLTTGFDAPHVDVIAILRPTESVSLYQQIVGRGLRLYEGKKDCLVLDYTGVPHDIFCPMISYRKPTPDAVSVKITCPKCNHTDDVWGVKDESGTVIEHFGKKCSGVTIDPNTGGIQPCGFRYRFTICDHCGAENDIGASNCERCSNILVDDTTKLRAASELHDAHVMSPDSMVLEKRFDKKGKERLEVRYYDLDGQHLSEVFFFDSPTSPKVFCLNFTRFHNRLPGRQLTISSIDEAIKCSSSFRKPLFIIARKQGKFWKIREKVFL